MSTHRCLCFLFTLAALSPAHASSGGQDEEPSSQAPDPDRFLINDGKLAIRRPDKSWEFKADVSRPPIVATMRSGDALAHANIQVQEVPGMELSVLKGMVENALAAQVQEFNKLSGDDVKVDERAAYVFVCTFKAAGATQKVKMLLFKSGDTLYVVKCATSPDDWKRFEKDFDKILASVRVLEDGNPGARDSK